MAIFVFGSNLAGRHGKGAALFARQNHGAQYGVGVGRTGNSYAIPTKNTSIQTLPLGEIERYVKDFLNYARQHPELEFQVTAIGTGLAGYSHSNIAPMFKDAPANCSLPPNTEADHMRNLLEYPVTKEETRDCLLRLREKAVADDEMAMCCGNLDSYILACAAYAVMAMNPEDFKEAFGITEDNDADLPK
jgi:hypothetical protein